MSIQAITMCHKYIGNAHTGHNYIGHNYIGHTYIGHTYVGHNCTGAAGRPGPARQMGLAAAIGRLRARAQVEPGQELPGTAPCTTS